MLNFNHLYYFFVIASEGSVKAAADRLGVTQPTISEQLRLLERALKTSLFDRTAGGLRLTRAGREAFEHSKTMFQAGERLVESLGHVTMPSQITLRVGLSSAVSRTTAADFLTPLVTFGDCYPVLVNGDFNDHLRQLRAHELDLVIGDTEPAKAALEGLETVVLHHPTLVAIAPPDLTPGEHWEQLPVLVYPPSCAYQWEIDSFLEQENLRPRISAEIDDAFFMIEAVANGGVVAFVPKSAARDALRVGRIKTLASLPPSKAGIFALFHQTEKNELVRGIVQKLADHAKSQLDA